MPSHDLGRLVGLHATSPPALQRAAIVAIVSFFFFMATLVVFYVQQSIAYFILSTAFLIVYIFTLIGWVMQKRNAVSIFENGISYRKFSASWNEIKSVKADPQTGITLVKDNGETLTIGNTTADIGRIALLVRQNLPS